MNEVELPDTTVIHVGSGVVTVRVAVGAAALGVHL